MSHVLELPRTSKVLIWITTLLTLLAVYLVSVNEYASLPLAVVVFFLSGFLADMVTAFVHFAIDHTVPSYRFPIFGPLSKEFHDHHDDPTQAPSDTNFNVNFTKGSYGTIPVLVPVTLWAWHGTEGVLSFFVLATLTGMCVWGLFVNQTHSYAHMGSYISSEKFRQCTDRVKNLSSEAEQRKEYEKLFETVPIPRPIRIMQKLGLILDPAAHNLHHIEFEKSFGILNGWSNPVANLILVPLSRYFIEKERSEWTTSKA